MSWSDPSDGSAQRAITDGTNERDPLNGRGWVAATYDWNGQPAKALVSPSYRDQLRDEGRLIADHGDERIVEAQGAFNPWNRKDDERER